MFNGAGGDKDAERDDSSSSYASETASEPMTQPVMDLGEIDVLLMQFRKQLFDLTSKHLAAVKKLSGEICGALAEGGVFLDRL